MANQRRYRNWCLTINNPGPGYSEYKFDSAISFAKWQLEEGELGTRHVQMYIELSEGAPLSQIQRWFPGCHAERRRGTQTQAIEYVSKIETRIEGPWSYGQPKRQGRRTDLEAIVRSVDEGKSTYDIIQADAGNLQYINYIDKYRACIRPQGRDIDGVCWLYGATGSGKTRTANELLPDAYWLDDRQPLWWQGYGGQQDIIIDEFRGRGIDYADMLRILSPYPYRCNIKGGSAPLRGTRFFITSHLHPHAYFNDQQGDFTELDRRLSELGSVVECQRAGDSFIYYREQDHTTFHTRHELLDVARDALRMNEP